MPRLRRSLFLAIVFLAGCNSGPEFLPVKGKVTYGGVAVESGVIQFEAADRLSPSGKGGIIKNGEYAAELPAGEFVVRITGMKAADKKKAYEDSPESPSMNSYQQYLPAKFNTETTLKVTIQAKKDDLDFNLEK